MLISIGAWLKSSMGRSGSRWGTSVVVQDAIRRLELSDETVVACIYPTAAFVTSEDLNAGFERLAENDWVFTVGAFPAPIQRAYAMSEGALLPVDKDAMPMRSQDLGVRYFDAGQFYLARVSTWTKPGAHVWDGAAGVVLPRRRCIDIDTEEDWAFAETLFGIAFPERADGRAPRAFPPARDAIDHTSPRPDAD